MSSSYRSSRLGLSHLDPYAMHRGGCLELYYCNMVEWFWWDSSLKKLTEVPAETKKMTYWTQVYTINCTIKYGYWNVMHIHMNAFCQCKSVHESTVTTL